MKRKSSKKVFLIATLCLSAFMLKAADVVVEASRLSSYRVDDVDTATFFGTSQAELPVTVDVLTGDFIREQAPNDLHDLLFYQPGINGGGKTLMDRTSGQYSVRGKSGSTPTINGTLPLTSAMGMYLDPNALERVEIVKGPVGSVQGGQPSTLGPYGAGGSINLILKQPKFDEQFFDVGLKSSFGSDLQRYRFTGDYNGELSPKLAMRLPFSVDTARPFWLPSGHDWRYSMLVAPAFLFQPSENFRAGLSTTIQYTDTPAYQGVPSFRGKPLAPYTWNSLMGEEHDFRDEYTGYTADVFAEWDANDIWQFRVGGGYAGSDVEYTHIASSTYANQPDVPTVNVFDLYWGDGHSDVYNVYGRAIARHELGGVKQTTVMQADILERRSKDQSSWSEMALDETPNPPMPPQTKSSLKRQGAFLQDHVEWNIFRFLAGIRFDDHESNLGNSGTAWSPRFGLSVVPTEKLVFFANASRTSAPNFGHMKNDNEELTSAWRADQAEAGVRTKLTGTLWLSVAGYYIDQRDTASLIPGSKFYETEGKSKNKGVELSLSGNLADNWSLYIGYAFNYNDTPSGTKKYDSQPPHSVTLQTMYRFASGWLDDVGVGLGYRYKHGYDGTMVGRYVSPDYYFDDVHVFDVSCDVPLARFGGSDGWALQLGVKNVFDSDYFESNRHYYQCFPGEPRTFEVGVSGKF